jgi:hypothetical protein
MPIPGWLPKLPKPTQNKLFHPKSKIPLRGKPQNLKTSKPENLTSNFQFCVALQLLVVVVVGSRVTFCISSF